MEEFQLEPLTLEMVAGFTYGKNGCYFLEVPEVGTFTWKDPTHDGDNVIRSFHGTYEDWLEGQNVYRGINYVKARIAEFCPGATIAEDVEEG